MSVETVCEYVDCSEFDAECAIEVSADVSHCFEV